ncbi:hypothetical protein IW139_002276 [Coemansia sp. RSA 353]|nr:hypothetical protein GGH97_001145 [Coemansia sp. RSA 475]KAJ2255677.1 hypothetical protein GGH98_001891 [Coemansia sp. RSA 454]KAJ2298466.1 hypothetical protein IW139_002276 [Coemansia sp. RSA 353]
MSEMPRPQLMFNSNSSTSSSLCSNELGYMPPSPTFGNYPAFSSSGVAHTSKRSSSRINLEGSWLDLESDDEDSYTRRSPLRMRRKNSGASAKDAAIARSPMANIRELTHRSTLRIRKLTDKMSR